MTGLAPAWRRLRAWMGAHRLRAWGAALAALALAAVLLGPPLARLYYPVHYGAAVRQAAAEAGFDPYLLFAVIRVESGFNPRAQSPKGARGLMQVMPQTGAWVAAQLGMERYHPDALFDPETNIRLGTWYLAYLYRRFDGSLPLALAAYNGGQGNVQRWLETSRWDGSATTVHHIPFGETRTFVRRVLKAYGRYRWVYGARNGRTPSVSTLSRADSYRRSSLEATGPTR